MKQKLASLDETKDSTKKSLPESNTKEKSSESSKDAEFLSLIAQLQSKEVQISLIFIEEYKY